MIQGGCLFLLCNFIQHMESQRALLVSNEKILSNADLINDQNEALVSRTCTPMSDFELDEGETFDSLCAYFEAHSAYLTAAKETMNDIMPQVAQLQESAAQKAPPLPINPCTTSNICTYSSLSLYLSLCVQ